MEDPSKRPPRIRAWHLALLLAPAVYLVALGNVPIQLPDEPRETELAREMWVNGPISVPRVNGELHPIKPPVMFWCASAIFSLAGDKVPTEATVRLAPALFSVGSLALAFLFGSLWFSRRHGALAACALALSPEMISHGRKFLTDPALAFFFTLALGAGLTAYARKERWLLAAILGGVALGLAFLSKGIIAVVFTGLALGSAIVARDGKRALSAKTVAMAAIYLACLAPAVAFWFWLLRRDGGSELVKVYLDYHKGGAKGDEGTPHLKPWWFYIVRGTDGAMPWLFFLPLCFFRAPAKDGTPRPAPLLREVALWAGMPALFLSFGLAQKRDVYTLPLLAPLAILAAVAILDAPREGWPGRIARWGWTLLHTAFEIGALAGVIGGFVLGIRGGSLTDLVLAGALLVVFVAIHFISWFDPDEREAALRHPFGVMGLGAIIAISLLAFLQPVYRSDNTLRTVMQGLIAEARRDPGVEIHGYKLGDGTAVVNGALAYELGATFPDATSPEELRRVLTDPHSRVIAHRKVYDDLGRPGRVVAELKAEKKVFVLFAPAGS